MKKLTDPPMLFSPQERQACLADIIKFILARRKMRLEQAAELLLKELPSTLRPDFDEDMPF